MRLLALLNKGNRKAMLSLHMVPAIPLLHTVLMHASRKPWREHKEKSPVNLSLGKIKLKKKKRKGTKGHHDNSV